jgi:hypothetical protein
MKPTNSRNRRVEMPIIKPDRDDDNNKKIKSTNSRNGLVGMPITIVSTNSRNGLVGMPITIVSTNSKSWVGVDFVCTKSTLFVCSISVACLCLS